MGFNTNKNQHNHLYQKEASLINRLRNAPLHSTEKLLNGLPTNRKFLNDIFLKKSLSINNTTSIAFMVIKTNNNKDLN